MSFRFKKLYADCVTDDGTVCVVYVAWLDVFGARSTHAGLELYSPDGRREVIRARALSHHVDADGVTIELDVPGGPFVLEQRSVHGAWVPSGGPPHENLQWSVVTARAETVGRFTSDPSRPVLRGLGYADWVDIGRPTRRLGLRLLQWGRVHLPDSTVVFNIVGFKSRGSWIRGAEWSDDGPREVGELAIVGADDAVNVLTMPARRSTEGTTSIDIERARTLHAGDPIDAERFPGVVERVLSGVITGPADEDRRLGRARSSREGRAAPGGRCTSPCDSARRHSRSIRACPQVET